MRFKIILLLTTLMFSTTACCLFDYSEEIKEVAEPMLKTLETFYQKNKRFPTDKERDEMLVASGCESVVGGVCERGWNDIVIEKRKIEKHDYYIAFWINRSMCVVRFDTNGKAPFPISCYNYGCIHGLSH